MKIDFTHNIGMLLLGIWLVLMGLTLFIPAIADLDQILSVLALAAGIFVLLGR